MDSRLMLELFLMKVEEHSIELLLSISKTENDLYWIELYSNDVWLVKKKDFWDSLQIFFLSLGKMEWLLPSNSRWAKSNYFSSLG